MMLPMIKLKLKSYQMKEKVIILFVYFSDKKVIIGNSEIGII